VGDQGDYVMGSFGKKEEKPRDTEFRWVDTEVIFDYLRDDWMIARFPDSSTVDRRDENDNKLHFLMYRREKG
jgi:hypothetical protein